jgi:hypothetical protein
MEPPEGRGTLDHGVADGLGDGGSARGVGIVGSTEDVDDVRICGKVGGEMRWLMKTNLMGR